ncbi:hypothetical protein [Sulfurimonas sp.]|uniref:hypothetical protein n=1 Tax=Sulfurimonas sp. TaxID=2022749 RepID=UPI002B4807F8|nr:hypothetical protein [Sulfurimonas sp.]
MSETLKNILIASISALLAFAGSYYIYSEQLKINKLDLHNDFDANYFSKPKFPSDDIILTVNNIEKEQLGILKISLMNFSAKNFPDIPIKIKITPKNIKDFKILSYSAVGEKEFYDNVSETKKMFFDGTSYYFSYIVSSMNRTEKSNYGLQLRVLFEGTEEPKVSISAKDVSIRNYDVSNSPYQKSFNFKVSMFGIAILVGFFIILMLLLVTILGPIISLITKKSDRQNRQKYALEIFEAIKSDSLQVGTSDEQIRDFVASMLYKQQLERWNKKTIIGKWSLGMIVPNKADHTIEL